MISIYCGSLAPTYNSLGPQNIAYTKEPENPDPALCFLQAF